MEWARIESQYRGDCRIREWLGLERTLNIPSQTPGASKLNQQLYGELYLQCDSWAGMDTRSVSHSWIIDNSVSFGIQ